MGKDSRLKAVAPKEEKEPIALPTHLDAGDLAYQQFLIAKIQREQGEHQAALRTWTDFLTKRYQLGPSDRVDEAGTITRVDLGKGGTS